MFALKHFKGMRNEERIVADADALFATLKLDSTKRLTVDGATPAAVGNRIAMQVDETLRKDGSCQVSGVHVCMCVCVCVRARMIAFTDTEPRFRRTPTTVASQGLAKASTTTRRIHTRSVRFGWAPALCVTRITGSASSLELTSTRPTCSSTAIRRLRIHTGPL